MNSSRSRSSWVAWAIGLTGAAFGVALGLGLARLWERWSEGTDAAPDEGAGSNPHDLEAEVRARIAADRDLGQRDVQVSVLAPGLVELTGTVASRGEVARAAQIARAVAGVRTVLNRLIAPELMAPRDDLSARVHRRRGGSGPAITDAP